MVEYELSEIIQGRRGAEMVYEYEQSVIDRVIAQISTCQSLRELDRVLHAFCLNRGYRILRQQIAKRFKI